VAQSLPTVLPSHTFHDPSLVAPTPALISAPTPAPAPILVNNTALPVQPPVVSSNSYSFDPSGLTPAQQLAYAQAQQQHQQQHLKKMRQRLPHGGKQGSPHMSRKTLDGPAGMIGGAYLPSAALLHEAKLVGTPDTLSETGSLKSGRSRSRTLPILPPEEPAPLPSQKHRISSSRKNFANFRQSSLDGMTNRSLGTGLSRARPSNSETNLRKLAFDERNSRPTSALGLIQASSVVSSHGPSRTAREHEKRILESILPPDLRHLITGGPSTWSSIQQIESSLKTVQLAEKSSGPSASEVARLNAEKKLFGNQRERIVAEMQRYTASKDPRLRAEMKHKLNPVMDAQLNRNRRMNRHRRNLSDGGHIGEDFGFHGLPNRPYSSMSGGYLSTQGHLVGDHLAAGYDPLGLDNSASYLGMEAGPGASGTPPSPGASGTRRGTGTWMAGRAYWQVTEFCIGERARAA